MAKDTTTATTAPAESVSTPVAAEVANTTTAEATPVVTADGFAKEFGVNEAHSRYMRGRLNHLKSEKDINAFLDEFASSDAKRSRMKGQLEALVSTAQAGGS